MIAGYQRPQIRTEFPLSSVADQSSLHLNMAKTKRCMRLMMMLKVGGGNGTLGMFTICQLQSQPIFGIYLTSSGSIMKSDSYFPLSARLAEEKVPRPVRDVWDNQPLFPSLDINVPLTLQELRNLPIEDDSGHEVPLYTADGFQVKRRLGRFGNTPPLGVLINIATIDDLFKPNHADTTVYRHGNPGPKKNPQLSVYPQAGLRSAGHFQASGLMTSFYPLIEAMNELLRDGEDARFPVKGVACQGYNNVMHTTRGYGVQHHEAQQGLVTAAIGGQFACDQKGRAKCDTFSKSCNRALPHRIFDRKISNNAIKRDLRLENVYVIDMTAMREVDRSGE
jgi:hypothetical protein